MSRIRKFASRIDDVLDHARMHLRRFTGLDDPVTVHVHRGFGRPDTLHVAGSVVTTDDDAPGRHRIALLNDIRATIRRYIERGVMGAVVRVRHREHETTARTDSDGFFHAELRIEPARARSAFLPVAVTLESAPGLRKDVTEVFAGEVVIPPPSARFGVISDMDDTVLRTGVHDFRANWRQIIRSDPALREPFPGLAELYRDLVLDGDGDVRNPIFYVSSAAWGFYDLFEEFLRHRDIPRGPFFLKNYGLNENQWFKGGHSDHKTRAVERLFGTYPDMPFILVGDSGQADAGIYREVVRNHPGRVLAVWIRDVTGEGPRREEVAALMAEISEMGVPTAFGPTLLAAARMAAEQGWIAADAVPRVEDAVDAAVEG